MTTKYYTTRQAAAILHVSVRRIQAMLVQDQNPARRITHFPHALVCPCGRGYLIPERDLKTTPVVDNS